MSKVYISGPISGTADYMERFEKAEQRLVGCGYMAVNPAKELSTLPEGTRWEAYMGEALKLLCGCDSIYFLYGWLGSRGAKIEYEVARGLGLTFLIEKEGAEL